MSTSTLPATRTRDPETSHLAELLISDRKKKIQRRVLEIHIENAHRGGLADFELEATYAESFGSPRGKSTVRTRRHELCVLGLLIPTQERRREYAYGFPFRVWTINPGRVILPEEATR